MCLVVPQPLGDVPGILKGVASIVDEINQQSRGRRLPSLPPRPRRETQKAANMSRFAPHRPSASNPRATKDTVCQKCLGKGHFTYNCKSTARPYITRPSRTQMLEQPDKYAPRGRGDGSDVPPEFLSKKGLADKILKEQEMRRKEEEASKKLLKAKEDSS